MISGIISALQPWSGKAEQSTPQRWPRWQWWSAWGPYWKLTLGNADLLIGSQGDAKRKRGGGERSQWWVCRSKTWWTALTGEYSKTSASHWWWRSWGWRRIAGLGKRRKFKHPLGVSSRRTRRMEAEENQKRLIPDRRLLSTNAWIQRRIVPKVDGCPNQERSPSTGLTEESWDASILADLFITPHMFIHMLFIFSFHWSILVSPTFWGHPLVPQFPLSPPNVLVL